MMPEWMIWILYAIGALAFGGVCISIYEFTMNLVRCF